MSEVLIRNCNDLLSFIPEVGDAIKLELPSSEKNFLTLIVYLVKNTDDFRQPKFLYPKLGRLDSNRWPEYNVKMEM